MPADVPLDTDIRIEGGIWTTLEIFMSVTGLVCSYWGPDGWLRIKPVRREKFLDYRLVAERHSSAAVGAH